MKHKTIAVLCASAVVLIIACLIAGELPPEGGGAASQNVSPALGQPSGILPDGQVCAPCSGASCEGRDYRTLVRQFRDAGFENLSLIAEDTGFDGAAVFDGCVLFVSIDGDKAFSNETVFAPDAAVEIHYAVKSEDESAASSGASAESSAAAANADEMVWIPQSGAKYHTRADCGNMIAPRQVTQSEAERVGLHALPTLPLTAGRRAEKANVPPVIRGGTRISLNFTA